MADAVKKRSRKWVEVKRAKQCGLDADDYASLVTGALKGAGEKTRVTVIRDADGRCVDLRVHRQVKGDAT